MRILEDKDLVGKTIKSINKTSVNMIRLNFSDGTSLELWAESAVYTPMGTIPGIFAEDCVDHSCAQCDDCEDYMNDIYDRVKHICSKV